MYKNIKELINLVYGTPKVNIVLGERCNGKKAYLESLGYKLTLTNKPGWYKIEKVNKNGQN